MHLSKAAISVTGNIHKGGFMRTMKKTKCFMIMCLIFVMSVSLLSAAGQTETRPIVLRAISFAPLTHVNAAPFQVFMDRVNEQAGGELRIEYVGASEVTPIYDQPQALRTGVFDMLMTFSATHESLLPLTGGMNLGNLNPSAWRESGAHDFLIDEFKTENIMFLGSFASYEDGNYVFINQPISKPEELAGMRFAAGPTNIRALAAWGGSGVMVSLAEKYSALERRIVDGTAGVMTSHYNDSLYEVTRYWLPYSLNSALTSVLVNQDKWNQIPAHLQQLMIDVMVELEVEAEQSLTASANAMKQKLLDAGMIVNEFSPADAERFLDVALGAKWAEIEKTVDPQKVSTFRALLNE